MRSLERRLTRLESLAAEGARMPDIQFGPDHLLERLRDDTCPACRARSQVLERALDGLDWQLSDRCPGCGTSLDDALITPAPDAYMRIVSGWYRTVRGAVARDLGISPRLVPRKPELAASLAIYWLGFFFRGEQRALEMLRASLESRPAASLVRDSEHGGGVDSIERVFEHHRRLKRDSTLSGRYFLRSDRIDARWWIDDEGYLIDRLDAMAYMTPSELDLLAEQIPEAAEELRAMLVPPHTYRIDESLLQLTYQAWVWRQPH